VVSKWVGETEKLLARLFDAAEQAPCLLLFDEADALFGSRSDVKDAQDRFANLEVSYLLQRLESFQGVAVLTTNIKRNIDEAFLRRFTAVVEFPFPEAAERLRIWERVLPTAFPLASDVSLPAVAEEFKLAGANIWNVAVAAGVAAAGSSSREISRSILAHAIKREYQKLGRKLAALRPQLLSSEEEAQGEMPRKRLRSKAISAAEARRRRVNTGGEALNEGAALPGLDEPSRAKPTA
jgi:SpoVK/Ycf46/Vps4 family AAA+-type ATPase